MNFYTPHGHAGYATQQPINNANNNHNHTSNDSLSQQQRVALQAALNTFDQPPAPSLREVLGAYRLKGDGDREMLLAILNAKAAEDQRIAAMAQLHQTILQVNHAHLAQNVLANQLPPLVSSSGAGLGTGLGHNSPHSHHQGITSASSSPPTRSQLMSISSLIGEDGIDVESHSPRRRLGSNNDSTSTGSRSPVSVGTSAGGGRRSYQKTSSERSTS